MRDVTHVGYLKRIIGLTPVEILAKDPSHTDIYTGLAEAMIGQAIQYFGLDVLIYQRSQPKAA